MRKLLLHKLFVYYHSSMKNNIKTNIVLISLIPIFILLVIFYSVLSQNQWLKVQDDVQDLINKSAIFINMELESYLQSSIKIATSAVIRNGLHEDLSLIHISASFLRQAGIFCPISFQIRPGRQGGLISSVGALYTDFKSAENCLISL